MVFLALKNINVVHTPIFYHGEGHAPRGVHGREPHVVHGSPSRARTCDILVTLIQVLLQGVDYITTMIHDGF